jgi:ABC-2 type transport system permease protein
MRRFYANHPRWADSPPLGHEFHYKWNLAFHQNGDETDQNLPYVHRTIGAPEQLALGLTRLCVCE